MKISGIWYSSAINATNMIACMTSIPVRTLPLKTRATHRPPVSITAAVEPVTPPIVNHRKGIRKNTEPPTTNRAALYQCFVTTLYITPAKFSTRYTTNTGNIKTPKPLHML